jgi:hypothetical protein
MLFIGKSKEQLKQVGLPEVKKEVEQDAWIALKQYFDGKGNGPEAKVACIVIGTLAREEQSKNNARQLDIIEARMGKMLPGTKT